MSTKHVEKFTHRLQAVAAETAIFKKGRVYVALKSRYEKDGLPPNKTYELRSCKNNDVLATMTAQSLPGCCGIILFHTFSGDADKVAKFIGIGVEAGRRSGYGSALLTLREGSSIIELLPSHTGHTFVNGKTGNRITIVRIDIPQNVKPIKATEGE